MTSSSMARSLRASVSTYAIQINATRTLGSELGAIASIMIAACLAFCHLVSQPIYRTLRRRLLS